MRQNIFIILLLQLIAVQLIQAQDTVSLKNGRSVIGETLEISEEYVQIKVAKAKDSVMKIALYRVRLIKYAGGFSETYNVKEPVYDSIKLVNARSLSGLIAEVEEDGILVRLQPDEDAIIKIRFDSIAHIRYANGYFENYHAVRIAPEPARQEIAANALLPQKDIAKGKETVLEKEEPVKEKKRGKNKKEQKALADNKQNPATPPDPNRKRSFIAIGTVLDSASGLSRSVALHELLKTNMLRNEQDTLHPVLTDYPYGAPYAITGIFLSTKAKFRIYKNGKKVKEFTCPADWNNVFTQVKTYMETEQFMAGKKIKPVSEGIKYKFHERNISNMLPGAVINVVPKSPLTDTFSRNAKLSFYKDDYVHLHAKEVYGIYTHYNENDLFFFRNNDVPFNLKHTVRNVVFPLSKWLGPSLTYLGCGYSLYKKKDAHGALNLYLSALNSSNSLLASPMERGLLKYLTFNEIQSIYRKEYPERKYLADLFQLGADMNNAFTRSADAEDQREKYYGGIAKISKISDEAEAKAREIRGTKRFGLFMAVVNTAGAVATASPYDNTTSQAFMDQALVAIDESYTQANSASTMLSESFDNIHEQIDARSFTVSDGSDIELGRSYLAPEVIYFLSFKPDLVKSVLLRFAANMPKFYSLLNNFYDSYDTGNKQESLRKIYEHLSIVEARVVASESRGIPVSPSTIAEF